MDKLETSERLYKADKGDRRRVWFVERLGRAYRMASGIDGGKIVRSAWTNAKGKNVGRSNETDCDQQAIIEVDALYVKKRKEGYAAEGEEPTTFVEPMLALKWAVLGPKVDFDKLVFSQPKLDGIRCIATPDGLFTRTGEPITSCPHIAEEALDLVRRCGYNLDGELYNHDLKDDFNKIASLVRKQKSKPADHETTRAIVQYHVYDILDETADFNTRTRRMDTIFREELNFYMFPVETYVADDREQLDALYADYLEDGYEGQMVRIGGSLYEAGRSKGLLKRKELDDDEFEIAGVLEGEGNRSGMAGKVKLWFHDKKPRRGHPDGTFKAGIKGGVKRNRELLENAEGYVTQMATIRFQGYTPDGVPRFPVLHDIGRRD